MNEPKPMQEIHAIQENIYEETKHLSVEEKVERINQTVEDAIKKYSLKFIKHHNRRAA